MKTFQAFSISGRGAKNVKKTDPRLRDEETLLSLLPVDRKTKTKRKRKRDSQTTWTKKSFK